MRKQQNHWTDLRDKSKVRELFNSPQGMTPGTHEPWQAEQAKAFVLKPLTAGQEVYFKAIEKSRITLVSGPAGAGKTWIACGLAAKMFNEGIIDHIVITRPMVSCGDGYGFRPGTTDEKAAPVMRPMLDALSEFFGTAYFKKLTEQKKIEMWPLDDMRGASIKRSFMICDEAQNATYAQLHMFLTRFARDTRVVVMGDASQTDLPHTGKNPFLEVIRRYRANLHPKVSLIRLTRKDIVRDELVRWSDEQLSNSTFTEEDDGAWYNFVCPGCSHTNWFENGDESVDGFEDVDCVNCWKCNSAIALFSADEWNVHKASKRERHARVVNGQSRPV